MKAFVAMSGGVDSAACAVLLQRQGFDVEGITMVLHGRPEVEAAREACGDMGIPHHVIDLRGQFARRVIGPFADDYLCGRTPNPCVTCNREIKFGLLMEAAFEMGAQRFATGHFARIEADGQGGFLLKKAVDPKKDQSYVLYSLKAEQLGRILLPLGGLTKEDTRAIAAGHRLGAATSAESQDICFVPDGDYAGYIRGLAGGGDTPGRFVDRQGNTLGTHRGITRYTIGQRKGLGIAWAHPLYVLAKDAAANTVTLGPAEELLRESIAVGGLSWVGAAPSGPVQARVRTRYHQREAPATVTPAGAGQARVDFCTPVRAPAPGQAAVFYDGDIVLGGGIIL